MHHAPLNSFKEERLRFWVRPFGGDDGVDVVRAQQLPSVLQEYQDVHVGQAAFLEFDGVNIGGAFPKDYEYFT
jgi:hypothetical protein